VIIFVIFQCMKKWRPKITDKMMASGASGKFCASHPNCVNYEFGAKLSHFYSQKQTISFVRLERYAPDLIFLDLFFLACYNPE